MIQRMIIRITSPIVTAATVFIGMYILQNPVAISLISFTGVAYLSHSCYNRRQNSIKIKHSSNNNNHIDDDTSFAIL